LLTYTNVNLRHRHSRHFWLTFLQDFYNCDCRRYIKRRAFISWSRKLRVTSQERQVSSIKGSINLIRLRLGTATVRYPI